MFRQVRVSVLLAILAVFLVCSAMADPSFAPPRPTGLRKTATAAEREFIARSTLSPAQAAALRARTLHPGPLPSLHKNLQFLPAVREQKLANCGAFAPTYYYKTWQEARERGWTRPDPAINPERVMSPGFTFPLSNGSENDGANMAHVMAILCRFGCAPWSVMPENPFDWASYPNETAWRAAAPYRAGALLPAIPLNTDEGLAQLKAHLFSGDLAITDCLLYYDVFTEYGSNDSLPGVNNDVIFSTGSSVWAYHAFTIIGYDDNKEYFDGSTTRTGALLLVNSWGEGWGAYDAEAGTRGFVWFAYDFVKAGRGSMADPALVMTDRIGYEPKDFAVLELAHPRRAELSIRIAAGPRLSPFAPGYIELFPNAGSLQPFSGVIVADITDFRAYDPSVYWIQIEDVWVDGWSVTTGTIERFEIQKSDPPATFTAALTPFETQDDAMIYLSAGLMAPSDSLPESAGGQCLRMAWGDYNRDGRPDLAMVSGNSLNFSPSFKILRNAGSGRLEDSGIVLPQLSFGAVAWADYDRDGWPDLAFTGVTTEPVFMTKVYRNTGFGSFADSGAVLPGLSDSPQLAWGDYDNDGDPDLVLCGASNATGSWTPITKLYRNDNGTFVDSGIGLQPQRGGPLSWADMNNDGWLDLAIGQLIYSNNAGSSLTWTNNLINGGWHGAHAWADFDGDGLLDVACLMRDTVSGPGVDLTTLYANNGDFTFTDTVAGLRGLSSGDIGWCDYDNDGLLDLAFCGTPAGSSEFIASVLMRQRPAGVFGDSGIEITPALGGALAWVDADSDGDAELIVSGDADGNIFPVISATSYYSSLAADPDAGARPNTPPDPPANPIAEADGGAGAARLSWSPAHDAETSTPLSLSYEVRVGRNPGQCDVVSPYNGLSLLGSRVHPMIAVDRPGLRLRNLAPGRYYWSVQTLDGGMAASSWTLEQVFVINAGGLVSKDVNCDGRFDVADVVLAADMAAGRVAPNPAQGDINGDGRVDFMDPAQLGRELIGKGPDGYIPVTTVTIGPAGGTIAAAGLELIVPSGAFVRNTPVGVSLSVIEQPYGAGSGPLTYRLDNLPLDTMTPLTLRIWDTRGKPSKPFIALGVETYARSAEAMRLNFRVREATKKADGYATVILPALGAMPPSEGVQAGRNPLAAGDWPYGYGFYLVCNLLSQDQWRYDYPVTDPKFRIIAPDTTTQSAMIQIAQDFQAAYDKLNALGFDMTKRDWKNYPLEVTLRDMGLGSNGEPLAGATGAGWGGDNDASIDLNIRSIPERQNTRISAVHEFFHVIQGFYEPSSRLWKCMGSTNLWFDEATATWFEDFFVTDAANYASENYKSNKYKPILGYFSAPGDGLSARAYGYGAANIIKHVAKDDPKILSAIYTKLKAKTECMNAFRLTIPGGTTWQWWQDAWVQTALGSYYNWVVSDVTDIFVKNDYQMVIKTEADHYKLMPPKLPDRMSILSVRFYTVMFPWDYKGLTDQHSIAFKLTGDNTQRLTVLQRGLRTNEIVDEGVYSAGDGASRVLLPNIKTVADAKDRLIAVVTQASDDPNYRNSLPVKMEVGIVRDYDNQALTPVSFWPRNMAINGVWIPFPNWTANLSFSATAVGNLRDRNTVDSSGKNVKWIKMDLWGATPSVVDMELSATASPLTYRVESFLGYYYWYSIPGAKTYRLTKYRIVAPNAPLEPIWSRDSGSSSAPGAFSIALDAGEESAFFGGYIVCDITSDYRDASDVSQPGYPKVSETKTSAFYLMLYRR